MDNKSNNSELGGKAKNLTILKNAGFRVPEFITIVDEISEKELLNLIDINFKIKYFAVRSSAIVEDGTQTSFAGHFYSAVGVTFENLFKEYLNVRKSFGNQSGAVIIQEFVPSAKSGVLFTDAGENKILINANFGLCKSVVEGEPCDEYIYSRNSIPLKEHIEKNKNPLFFDNGNFNKKLKSAEKVLNENEIKLLIDKCLEIEKNFGIPQDIEWCFYNEELFILQSRPVTRKVFQKNEKIYYDSANIAESYSGIVKPLTLSFASEIYKTVYINLLHASGASNKKLMRYIEIFNKMTASFYGRLYYNMNNWYLMMKFIPGYDRNKTNLEDMITSNIRENVSAEIQPSFWLRFFYPIILVFKILFFPFIVRKFEKKVRKYIRDFRKSNFKQYSANQCIEKYKELEKELLSKWHITVENDFLVMTYLGILKKNLKDNEIQQYIGFENKSAKQVEKLKYLVSEIFKDEALKKYVIDENVVEFEINIKNNKHISNLLDEYFENYGGRFANELKLESSDIEEDKSKLLKLFKLYENFQNRTINQKSEIPEKFIVRYALKKFKKYASKREVLRLLRSNTFSVVRKIFNRIGEELVENKLINLVDDIFYLEISEIFEFEKYLKTDYLKNQVSQRKINYENFSKITPQPFFGICEGEEVPLKEYSENIEKTLRGRPCTYGKIKGKVKVFKEYFIPDEIDFDILVTKNTDPGWTTLIGLSKGMIIEHGGILSHAAIVSRELGIPTVIGVENVVEILKDNQIVEIDGSTGKIEIIN